MTDLSSKVTDILNYGLDVLVYSGDKDFICNWRGGEAWTNAVDWDGASDYANAETGDWTIDGNVAGSLKTFSNLKFLRVFDAGHMVPMNQPVNALAMLNNFTSGNILAEEKSVFIQ